MGMAIAIAASLLVAVVILWLLARPESDPEEEELAGMVTAAAGLTGVAFTDESAGDADGPSE
jgi:hypothetical protein